MKRTKRILAALLCVTLLLGMAACSSGASDGIPTLEKVAKDVKKNDGELSEKMEEQLKGWTLDEFKEAWGTYGNFLMDYTSSRWYLSDLDLTLRVEFGGYNPDMKAPSTSAKILH